MVGKRLKSNRFLPKFVSRFVSQHGVERFRFRRKGFPPGYFKAALGTDEFRAEYHAFMNPGVGVARSSIQKGKPGSIDEMFFRYISVPERLGPSSITQQKVRAVLDDFRETLTTEDLHRIGDLPIAMVTFEAIDKLIARKRVKTGIGNKARGGIHAARKLRKELVRFFAFAEKNGALAKNPAALTERVKVSVGERTDGFHTWTEAEISQFRQRHELGSRERLAMELILWTDQRRSDVVKMGKAQIQNGRLPVLQEKTGKQLWLPIAPQLLEAIIAMNPGDTSPVCFLVTRRGRPFTKESFGNFFKKACVAAGLPHCSAHGLRKATLRRMAELEMPNKTMKSVSGQTQDKTLEIYTRSANQAMLAESAISQLAAWESRLRSELGEVANARSAEN